MKVLLFASLTDLMGADEIELALESPCTVAEFLERLESAHPQLKRYQRRFRVALNQEFVQGHDRVGPGDEVALIPPVSGGSGPYLRSAIRHEPIDLTALTKEVMRKDCGAVVTFMGTVRDLTGEQVTLKLEYSAYREMAEKKLLEICEQALERWSLGAVVVEHRVGELLPGDIAVIVACSSPHRKDAFEAARFLIDATKEQVPLWKKEFGPEGEFWPEPVEGSGISP